MCNLEIPSIGKCVGLQLPAHVPEGIEPLWGGLAQPWGVVAPFAWLPEEGCVVIKLLLLRVHILGLGISRRGLLAALVSRQVEYVKVQDCICTQLPVDSSYCIWFLCFCG